MTQKKKTKRVTNLYLQQNGKCYWCDEVMIAGLDVDMVRTQQPELLNRLFTIDHINDRNNNLTRLGPVVGACHQCNQRREQLSTALKLVQDKMKQGMIPSDNSLGYK